MKPSAPPNPQPLKCAVCGKKMTLSRTVAAPAKRQRYEFWQCEGCGHTHISANQIGSDTPDSTATA
jgi:DNA-directed RNA polymerase subunit RPC12/RpoP